MADTTKYRSGDRFARMLEAQKMESVGRLAGGLAHDFNNLLTVILAEADLLAGATGTELLEGLREIRRAAQRGAELTHRMLAFSRPAPALPAVVSINEIVSDTTRMLRRLLGDDIDLRTCLAPDAGSIKAIRGEIEQVLANLAINARDAMPCGGTLLIETRRVIIDVSDVRGDADMAPGAYVRLQVRDTGTGMTPEVQRRIFEPFFTTKTPGCGTGLGLTTSYGIVMQAGGQIVVESEPGAGSAFYVFLPLEPNSPSGFLTDERG